MPTKSKGRKHSAEPDASMAAPPPKELRAADGLSADAAPPATEGGTFVAVAPQGGPGRPRGPRDRDGRRGRGRGRGGAVARQQRMMRIEEGPEGRSPIRARPAGASGPQDCELGQHPRGPPRRRERRARPARPPGSDQPLQEGSSGAAAFLLQANGAMASGLDGAGKPHMLRQQPGGRGRGGPGRGGPGRGRGAGRGPQPVSEHIPFHGEEGVEREGFRGPRSFRGRGRGGQGRKMDGAAQAGSRPQPANVSAVPYLSVQGE